MASTNICTNYTTTNYTTNYTTRAANESIPANAIMTHCPWMITVFRKSHQIIFYYYIVMLVTALTLNSALLLLVFRFKITRRQSLTIYMSYIAVADMLCIIVHYTQIVHSLQYFSGLRWDVSAFEGILLCQVNRMMSHFIPMLSSWIVVVMAAERWISVRWPLQSAAICTTKNAVYALTFVTVATFLVCIPFAVSFEIHIPQRGGILIGQGGHIQCRYPVGSRWWHDRIAGIITNVYEVAGNVLPGLLLLVLSLLLLSTLKLAVSSAVVLDRRCGSTTKSHERAQKRLTVTIMAITASFTILMLPNAIYRTYYYYWNPLELNCDYVVKLLVRELLFALKNACCIATPLLCVFGGIDVKKAAKRSREANKRSQAKNYLISSTSNGIATNHRIHRDSFHRTPCLELASNNDYAALQAV